MGRAVIRKAASSSSCIAPGSIAPAPKKAGAKTPAGDRFMFRADKSKDPRCAWDLLTAI